MNVVSRQALRLAQTPPHTVAVEGSPPSEPMRWEATCTCGLSAWGDSPVAARRALDRHATAGDVGSNVAADRMVARGRLRRAIAELEAAAQAVDGHDPAISDEIRSLARVLVRQVRDDSVWVA